MIGTKIANDSVCKKTHSYRSDMENQIPRFLKVIMNVDEIDHEIELLKFQKRNIKQYVSQIVEDRFRKKYPRLSMQEIKKLYPEEIKRINEEVLKKSRQQIEFNLENLKSMRQKYSNDWNAFKTFTAKIFKKQIS